MGTWVNRKQNLQRRTSNYNHPFVVKPFGENTTASLLLLHQPKTNKTPDITLRASTRHLNTHIHNACHIFASTLNPGISPGEHLKRFFNIYFHLWNIFKQAFFRLFVCHRCCCRCRLSSQPLGHVPFACSPVSIRTPRRQLSRNKSIPVAPVVTETLVLHFRCKLPL